MSNSCQPCNLSFNTKDELANHTLNNHVGLGNKDIQIIDLESEDENNSSMEEQSFGCGLCSDTFNNFNALERHVDKKHVDTKHVDKKHVDRKHVKINNRKKEGTFISYNANIKKKEANISNISTSIKKKEVPRSAKKEHNYVHCQTCSLLLQASTKRHSNFRCKMYQKVKYYLLIKGREIKCQECSFKASTILDLSDHMLLEHGKSLDELVCICRDVFSLKKANRDVQQNNFIRHVYSKHQCSQVFD